MSRLKVLFLTTEYPSEELPTNGIFIREHARAASIHVDVAVVSLSRTPSHSGLYEVEPDDDELPTWRVHYRRFPRPISYLAFVLGALSAVRLLRRRGFDPNVIHANSHLSAFAALLLGAIFHRPVVYAEHWSIFLPDNPNDLRRSMRLLARFVLERSNAVLPVSDAMRDALVALAPRARVRVVPNVVDDALFRPSVDVQRRGERQRVLITAGLLAENRAKGVDLLLEAFTKVRSSRSDVRLEIVGDGQRRVEYEELARRLGVADCVTFHGFKPKRELAELMQASDLFVLASRFENNPCVVMEAMACGLPVVATRVGGIPEMVDECSGLLVPAQNVEALAAGILEVMDRLDAFDRGEIARAALERWGRETIGCTLAALYAELAAA